jgi:4-hydroxy-4-methyl-2-oxoglutarate aldolase
MTRSAAWLRALRELPTPNLSDALDQLGLRGTMHDIGPLSPDLPRMVGYARTVWQGPRPPDAEPSRGYARHVELVDQELAADDVVVIGIGGGLPASSWGALLSLRSRQRGAAGTIIDGPVRDPAEIAALQYPLFRRPTFCPAGSKLRLATLAIDVPISCGGVQVDPGALVVGDDSGVVVIPVSRADDVIDAARQICRMEQHLSQRLTEGGSFR